ncbi:4381_t:CDS:2 [Paraglomus occultum]|uniref:4381_t:CDS:1 n=1 Tax=Paraglomus occultum TaxID=144539 RepID=A0A9N8VKA8_9GLOM|nr:4381_t:CDS:2 [Paraglomus occultum]
MSKYSVQSTKVIPSAAWPCPPPIGVFIRDNAGATWHDWLNLLDALEADLEEMDFGDENWKKTQIKLKNARTLYDVFQAELEKNEKCIEKMLSAHGSMANAQDKGFQVQQDLFGNLLGKRSADVLDSGRGGRSLRQVRQRAMGSPSPFFSPGDEETVEGDDEEEVEEDDGESPIPMPLLVDIPSNYELVPPASCVLADGFDIAKVFFKYQRHALALARQHKLQLETNVQEILALSHTLLIKPEQHTPEMLCHFEEERLDHIHAIGLETVDYQSRPLSQDLEALMRNVSKRARASGKFDRALQTELLTNIMDKEPESTDALILYLWLDIMRKFPAKPTNLERESEGDLVTSYLALVINPFVTSGKQTRAVWPNTASTVAHKQKTVGRARQPDFKLAYVHQRQEVAECGYGEVKPDLKVADTFACNLDLVRIARLGKACLDDIVKKGVNGPVIPLFQVTGHKMCMYSFSLFADGIYLMLETGCVSLPMAVSELLPFVDDLEHLLGFRELCSNITNCLSGKRVANDDQNKLPKYLRKTLTTPQFEQVVDKTKSRKRKSTIRHN